MTATEIRTMTDIEAAWLSGLLDGEGCFDAQGTNPRVRVKMTDLDLVLRAAHAMNCNYYGDPDGAKRGHKMAWVAQVTGARAAHVMRSVLPLMSNRRTARITELLAAYDARARRVPSLAVVASAA